MMQKDIQQSKALSKGTFMSGENTDVRVRVRVCV